MTSFINAASTGVGPGLSDSPPMFGTLIFLKPALLGSVDVSDKC